MLSRISASGTKDKTHPAKSLIAVPNKNGLDYLSTGEIIYFEAKNRYTEIVTQTTRLLSSYNLGYFKEMMTDPCFYQIHRSFVVNLNFVKRYQNNGMVILSNGDYIPVAKAVRKEFLGLFSTNGRSVE